MLVLHDSKLGLLALRRHAAALWKTRGRAIVLSLCMAGTLFAKCDLAHSGEPVIGVVVPLTGPFASAGKQIVDGIVAGTASLSPKPALTVVDDQGSLLNTVEAFRRLAIGERVALITGFTAAGAVTAVSAATLEYAPPVLHLSPFYEPRSVNRPNVFGLVPAANSLIDATAQFARGNLQIRSATIVFGISQQYETLAQRLHQALSDVGIEDVRLQRFSPSDDPTRLADVVQSSDVIVLGPIFLPLQLIRNRVILVDPMPSLDNLARGTGFLISAPQAKLSEGQSISLDGTDDPKLLVGLRAYGFAVAEIASQAFSKGGGEPQIISAALQEQEFRTTFFGSVRFSRRTGFSNIRPVLSRYEGGKLTFVAACSKCD
jgi:hypothetical protein